MNLDYISEEHYKTLDHALAMLRTQNFESIVNKDGSYNTDLKAALVELQAFYSYHLNALMKNPIMETLGISEALILEIQAEHFEKSRSATVKNYTAHRFHRMVLNSLIDCGHSESFLSSNIRESLPNFEEKYRGNYRGARIRALQAEPYYTLLNSYIVKLNLVKLLFLFDNLDTSRAQIDSKQETYKHFFNTIVDAYNFNSYSNYSFNDSKPAGMNEKESIDSGVEFNMPIESFKRVLKADYELDSTLLQYQNRKVIICDLEEVSDQEVAQAAKKMKFSGDLSCVRCFKITKGYKIKDARVFNNYWELRRRSNSQIGDYFEDISDITYLVISETPTTSFQSITSSIGRCLSSVNRRVSGAVLDSLDLSF